MFFFFAMEFLQVVQYVFLAEGPSSLICETTVNKVLTILGFLHICMQPYFTHVINASLTKNAKYLDRYVVIKRMCIIGGGMLFARFLLAYLPGYSTMDFSKDGYASTEWLRGDKLCTFKGRYHLAWSIPMADPTYVIPGAAIHSFCMFAPFFALYEKKGMVVQGCFLFLFGPYLAGLITPNLMEQASIWCFFSIAQMSVGRRGGNNHPRGGRMEWLEAVRVRVLTRRPSFPCSSLSSSARSCCSASARP